MAAGTTVTWDGTAKTATCFDQCAPLRRGVPGASVRQVHERRAAAELRRQQAAAAEDELQREQLRRERPLVGRLVSAFTPKPAVGVASQPTKAWEVGAAGEQRVGEVLNRCAVAFPLHDRRMPGSTGNIDHIALGPAAVYVVDAKRYSGSVEKRAGRLYVAGRNRTPLVEAMHRQVAVVRDALADHDIPVRGVLCFVGAEWPALFARPLHIDGVVALWPARLVEVVGAAGPMTVARTMELARRLAAALPPA